MASTDAMRERIAAHPWPCGGVEVIRANRGYTLYSRRTGGQVARLRPTGENDDVRVLWWHGLGHAGRLRTPDHAAQPGTQLRRHRELLLDQCLTFKASRNVQTQAQGRSGNEVALQVEVLWTAACRLRNRCADPADLNRCILRSRRRTT